MVIWVTDRPYESLEELFYHVGLWFQDQSGRPNSHPSPVWHIQRIWREGFRVREGGGSGWLGAGRESRAWFYSGGM